MILSCSLDPRLFQLCRAPGVGLSSPMCTRFLIDSDGAHKCDDTRGVDSKQSDDGIDHTFVSAGGSGTLCWFFCLASFPSMFTRENRYRSTMDTRPRGGS